MIREEWLKACAEEIEKSIFLPLNEKIPPYRVSCSWPSSRGMSKKLRSIGECWPPEASSDKTTEIFISPVIDDPLRALDVLVHEMVHATVGTKCGHRGPFKSVALKVGLTGKMTSTSAGKELKERLNSVINQIGPYPHAALNPGENGKKKQSTRLLKAECPTHNYIVRLSKKTSELGLPLCPVCKETMTLN